jgi:hypothetical protein
VSFKHNRIYFGVRTAKWSVNDPESEELSEAIWRLKNNREHLTDAQCMLLSSVLSDYRHLVSGAGWYSIKTATNQLRRIIKALKERIEGEVI